MKEKVFVAAGAADFNDDRFNIEARKLGYLLAENKCAYYQGAFDEGLMGETYRAYVKRSKNVYIIAPNKYMSKASRMAAKAKIFTDSINERLTFIAEGCDAIIILPGGNGTLDELCNLLETRRAGEHKIKIIIVNLFGFWDNYLKQLDVMEGYGCFALQPIKDYINVVSSVEEAIELLSGKRLKKDG